MSHEYDYLARKICDLVELYPITGIYDYGCGKGDLIRAIRDMTTRNLVFTGIDLFHLWPEDKRPTNEDSITFIDKDSPDFTDLVSNSPQCDLMISTFALHHYQYPIAELQTMCKLTHPGGHLYIVDMDFNNDSPARITKNLFSYLGEMMAAFRDRYHRHHYSLPEALDLMKACPVTIIDSGVEAISVSEDEKKEEDEFTLKHIDLAQESVSNLEDGMLKELFTAALTMTKTFVEHKGSDFSSVFSLLAQVSSGKTP